MRKEKSIKNAITAFLSNFFSLLFGFVIQKIFIFNLGDELLGVNVLFTNIISMLSIVELGIGVAIVYSLYEPLYKNDKEVIKSLLKFYKSTYRLIALIILVLGIILIPFLPIIVKTGENINLIIVLLLFIADVVFSYLLSYKRSILQADQNNYIINIVHIFYTIGMYTCLGFVIILFKNYYAYLIVKCIWRLLENVVLSLYVNKKYPYVLEIANKIDSKEKNSIVKKVRGLFFHKIGSFVVLGTDSFIISHYLGNIILAYYSNYNLIISAISSLLSQFFQSLTPSVGNLLVEKDNKKTFELYKKIMFSNFWIYCFASIGIFLCMDSFISIWIGKERLLSIGVLAMLTINFYMMGLRSSIGVFKDAAGIFYEDRFVPIIESILNIIFSIILVRKFQLIGVFMGTFLSSLIVTFYSLPYFVFKNVFHDRMAIYYKLYFKYLFITIILTVSSKIAFNLLLCYININNIIISFVVAVVLSIIFGVVIVYLLFKNSDELKYFEEILVSILKKLKIMK